MTATHPRETLEETGSLRDTIVWLLYCGASFIGWAFVRAADTGRTALFWLDPRVHFASLRIRAVTDGRAVKNANKCAILVLYPKGPLPVFTRSIIEALNRSEFDLVVVSNCALDPETKSYLLERCCLLVERANVGRDFGGYKDGVAIALQRFPKLEKLLLANDSVFYLPHGLDGLIADLAGDGDIVGVSEIFEHHYHVAAFLISFGKAVIESVAFRSFWSRYRPVGTRRWAILRGEGALTTALVAAGFRARALYQTDMLRCRLERHSPGALLDEAKFLPAKGRRELLRKWSGNSRIGATPETAAGIAADIASVVRGRNQMHYGGFLFHRHLGLPVVKRDLVYREIYPLHDALANLKDIETPLLEAIAADFQARPKPADYGFMRWLFYRYGAI